MTCPHPSSLWRGLRIDVDDRNCRGEYLRCGPILVRRDGVAVLRDRDGGARAESLMASTVTTAGASGHATFPAECRRNAGAVL